MDEVRERLMLTYLRAAVALGVITVGYLILGVKQLFTGSLTPGLCYVLAGIIHSITSVICYRRYRRIARYI